MRRRPVDLGERAVVEESAGALRAETDAAAGVAAIAARRQSTAAQGETVAMVVKEVPPPVGTAGMVATAEMDSAQGTSAGVAVTAVPAARRREVAAVRLGRAAWARRADARASRAGAGPAQADSREWEVQAARLRARAGLMGKSGRE
jgi:hypothetical protein